MKARIENMLMSLKKTTQEQRGKKNTVLKARTNHLS